MCQCQERSRSAASARRAATELLSFASSGWWHLTERFGSISFYRCKSTSATPPLTGWEAATGKAPPPSLSAAQLDTGGASPVMASEVDANKNKSANGGDEQFLTPNVSPSSSPGSGNCRRHAKKSKLDGHALPAAATIPAWDAGALEC